MTNQQLQIDLMSLQGKLSVSQGLVAGAQGSAGIAVMPNAPVPGLIMLAQAVAAQQKALDEIQKILKKMA